MRIKVLAVIGALLAVSGPAGAWDDLRTVAETSGYARAGRLADVNAFLDALAARSALVRLGKIGETTEGREIPLAIVADPPVESPGDVGGRMVVLLFGSIHAGEVCGTDALLMLARDLVAAREAGDDALLDELVVCLAPVYNVDGFVRRGPGNRRGQVGPAETGERANAQGLDLNRDWVKMDAPETRAMVGFLNAWDPAVIVDTHTTNGSNHRFTMTYQGPKHPAGDAGVVSYGRDVMLPAVDERFEAATGYHAFFYGNFAEHHTKWTTYPAEPWYGAAYRGIRNRVSILTEAYAYASFEDRVRSTEAFCREVLRHAAEKRDEIGALIEAADARTVEAGRAGSPIALRTEARAFVEEATILGYDEPIESGAHGERARIDLATTPHREYQVPLFNDFVPTLTVARPSAYVVPGGFAGVIDRLRAHGVELSVAPEGFVRVVEAGVYRIDSVERAERVWEGRTRMELGLTLEDGSVEVRAGDVIVRTDQALGSLAAYVLEPEATGGLASWGFFDGLAVGGAYPVARVEDVGALLEALEGEE